MSDLDTGSGPPLAIAEWIDRLFAQEDLLRMGHGQRREDLNLGLGWLYYALARIVRPAKAVVIGSYRGFVPLVLGRALGENAEPGEVTFIDPSMADDFWSDPETVTRYFRDFGLNNVRHFRMTSQAFVETEAYATMGQIGLVFIDGYHTEEQAEFDYNAFEQRLAPRGTVLFHDSIVVRPDKVYGAEKAYEMRVKYFVDRLRARPELQLFDFPFGATGLTVLRKVDPTQIDPIREWLDGPP